MPLPGEGVPAVQPEAAEPVATPAEAEPDEADRALAGGLRTLPGVHRKNTVFVLHRSQGTGRAVRPHHRSEIGPVSRWRGVSGGQMW